MAIFESREARSRRKEHVAALEATVAAIDRSQAVIEFQLDGTITAANRNFLETLGYTLDEVRGKHHSIFVDPEFLCSPDYSEFWRALKSGEFLAAKYKRIGKGGREVWIQASYNPVFDRTGKPCKVIKFATDVTSFERERRENEAQRARSRAEQDEFIARLAGVLSDLAQGSLTARIEAPTDGPCAQLIGGFNAAMDSLQDRLQRIAATTEGIRSGTGEVSAATAGLAERTTQHSAALQDAAAALGEITATVRRNAEVASRARDAVAAAKAEAEGSGAVIGGAVQAMAEIDRSSRQIATIVGVINDIAFRTNLLALNAGVEAARAGEAGKGFAVVATEVRALAQRSAEAAGEIRGLIQAASSEVVKGVDLVGEAGRALERVLAQVGEANAIVLDMAASAQTQATGLAVVNSAVGQLDRALQQNAASTEQVLAAGYLLVQDAEELAALVTPFDLGEGASLRRKPLARSRASAGAQAARCEPAGRL
jgi:methyl-accepting chemotaxis protein